MTCSKISLSPWEVNDLKVYRDDFPYNPRWRSFPELTAIRPWQRYHGSHIGVYEPGRQVAVRLQMRASGPNFREFFRLRRISRRSPQANQIRENGTSLAHLFARTTTY